MLHVIYRSYGGENRKGRPDYYSKRLALTSFIRAVDECPVPVEVIYLNDGPIPGDLLALMQASGEIVGRSRLGNKGAVRAALAIPRQRGWPDDDLVWLAEDDYLYRPEALSVLAAAPAAFPSVDYFALYVSVTAHPAPGTVQPSFAPIPREWRDSEPRLVAGHTWQRAMSTTGTYGATVRALREDNRLLRAALWSGAGWDHTMCLLYQGFQPFPWPAVLNKARGVEAPRPLSLVRRARFLVIATIRAALNLWQMVRRGPRRELVAVEPALATHMENGWIASGTDWTAVAADRAAWPEFHERPAGREQRYTGHEPGSSRVSA